VERLFSSLRGVRNRTAHDKTLEDVGEETSSERQTGLTRWVSMSVTLPEPFDYAKISKPLEQRYLRKLNEKSSHLLW